MHQEDVDYVDEEFDNTLSLFQKNLEAQAAPSRGKNRPNFDQKWLDNVRTRLNEYEAGKCPSKPLKIWSFCGEPTSDSGSTQFGSPRISNDSNQFGLRGVLEKRTQMNMNDSFRFQVGSH